MTHAPLLEKRRRRAELNLVPLIDVLVMLVFFAFVTMQFKSAATLNLTLPKIETAGKNEFKGKVTIEIDEHGAITFNGHIVNGDQLSDLLTEAHNADQDMPVLIKADEKSQLRELTYVMDKCRERGMLNINLQSR
jgi:biopolymer transport protein ExbD